MSFPPGTEMFQFPGFAFVTYEFSHKSLRLISANPSRTESLLSLRPMRLCRPMKQNRGNFKRIT